MRWEGWIQRKGGINICTECENEYVYAFISQQKTSSWVCVNFGEMDTFMSVCVNYLAENPPGFKFAEEIPLREVNRTNSGEKGVGKREGREREREREREKEGMEEGN
jgi:hypothetical protein